jgi:hypothetical protein
LARILGVAEKIGGYSLARVAEGLRAFAEGAGIPRQRERYIVKDRSLVRKSDFVGRASDVMRTIGRTGRLVEIDLPFSARRIDIRTNMRIFGLARYEGLTAKVRIGPEAHGAVSFAREVRVRSIFAAHLGGAPAVPAVVKHDHRRGGWLLEEYVAGRMAEEADFVRFCRDHAVAFYGFSARGRPVGRLFSAERIAAIRGHLAALAPPLAGFAEDARLTVGLCHGDLHPSNILVGEDGRLWIVDWETGGVGPIVHDFLRAYFWYPSVRQPLVALLDALDPARKALPAMQQLGVMLAQMLQTRIDQTAGQAMVRALGFRKHRLGMSDAEAKADLASGIETCRAALAALGVEVSSAA